MCFDMLSPYLITLYSINYSSIGTAIRPPVKAKDHLLLLITQIKTEKEGERRKLWMDRLWKMRILVCNPTRRQAHNIMMIKAVG